MYSKKDYMDYFLEMKDIQSLTHKQIIHLFQTCIKYDAFKLGLQLYCRFMKSWDMTPDMLYRLTISIRDSCKFLEIKLFFIHQHFEILDVKAMNFLIEVLLLVFRR